MGMGINVHNKPVTNVKQRKKNERKTGKPKKDEREFMASRS